MSMPLDEAFVVMSAFSAAVFLNSDAAVQKNEDGNCRCSCCLVLQLLQKAKFLPRTMSEILLTGSGRDADRTP